MSILYCTLFLFVACTGSKPAQQGQHAIMNVLSNGGSFEYQTDRYVLDTFRRDLEQSAQGPLQAVKLEDEVLEQIGYFID